MTDVPPLAVDIDGTLTRPDGPGIDARVFAALRGWEAPVVVATGKAFPYPVALCHFLAIPERVVAENGGIVYAEDRIEVVADGETPRQVLEAYREAGGEVGFGRADTANRWRETEVVVHLDGDERLLRDLARDHGLEVVDTGYAYHVKDPGRDKGTGLRAVADLLELDPGAFVAVGDSENDAPAFEVAGYAYAVANADGAARDAADEVLDAAHADGFLAALDLIRDRS
ncbi:phosphoglycolate phosphatase [Halobacteriales archaeon QS_8_69_26]|nr:MAG: phosphoglycolate phosphatase [Halobacteriales archaeon QS_8_69_26]